MWVPWLPYFTTNFPCFWILCTACACAHLDLRMQKSSTSLRKTCSRILVVKFAGDPFGAIFILYSSPILLRTLPRSTQIDSTNLCGPRVLRRHRQSKQKLRSRTWTGQSSTNCQQIQQKKWFFLLLRYSLKINKLYYVPIKTTEAILYVVQKASGHAQYLTTCAKVQVWVS